MPLNLSTSDGDFTPYLKYNAKAGRFYVRPQGAASDIEVINPRLAFDMENIRTGWLFYAEGSGPEKVWDPSPSQAAPRPPGPQKFKRGFEVMVFGGDEVRGLGKLGLRELSSTAAVVITAMLKMYAQYEAGMKANPNKVPFFRCSNVIPIAGSYGTNYEPAFELIGWVERAKIPAFDERMERGGMGMTAPNGHNVPFETPGYDPLSDRNPPPPSPVDLNDSIPF